MATAREINEHELDELLELYQTLNPDDTELNVDEQLRTQWHSMLHNDSLDIVVVEYKGLLVSSCVLSITPNLTRNARPFAVLENVVTHEDYRQNGFGKQCVRAAIDRAKERDCYKIMLLTGSEETWKHDFYESCGFDKQAKTGFTLELH